MASFYTDKKTGDRGEAYVKELMEARNHKVIDYTDNPYYWKKDIDFNIAGFDVEVKTDMRMNRTGNIWIEDRIEHLDNGDITKGWWHYTEADYLFYLDGVSLDLHIYPIADLREYIGNHCVPKRTARDNYQEREGFCFPADAVPHQIIPAA